ncbi:hypothetical protein [Paraburkholderia sp.]|uniref:hypothetical protein n=1 Tax=Paraburkholderia sp. TaxID=1926495 RepID=UPI003C7D4849
MDIEQGIFENIKQIDHQSLFIFEQVFGRKLEEERPVLGHAATSLLSACSEATGGPMIIDATSAGLEGRSRAKVLIETGSRAKASKKMILDDLSVVALCITGAIKALDSGFLAEALSLTVTASRAIGIAEADFRQLRLAQQKTGEGGRKTNEAHKRNTEGDEEKVIAAYRAMNPKPKFATKIAEKLVQDAIGLPYRQVYDLVRAEMKSEKRKPILQSTD